VTSGGDTATAVVVIGGGPAGAATALALARRQVPVLVVEQTDGGGNPIGESLAPSATPLLHRLGLHDALLASGPRPCHGNRSRWGGDGGLAERDFLREPYGPGWHLDRPAFNAALLAAAAAGGADCRRQARFRRAERRDGRWHLLVEEPAGPHSIQADLVVDASGRSAVFARQRGARQRMLDRLVAVVAFLEPGAGLGSAPMPVSTTLIEAAEEGWWYSAPLPNGCLATAFFSDPDLLAHRRPWHPSGWHTLLACSPQTLARVRDHGFRLAAPPRFAAAASTLLEPGWGEGWVSVGDAAATYDPLSSHGIGSALAAGQRVAAAAEAWLGGEEGTLLEFAAGLETGYASYLQMKRAYYADEGRWPEAPFWRRRRGEPAAEAERRV